MDFGLNMSPTSGFENFDNGNVISEMETKKTPLDFDLNMKADMGFDLNKFPEEGYEVIQKVKFSAV